MFCDFLLVVFLVCVVLIMLGFDVLVFNIGFNLMCVGFFIML